MSNLEKEFTETLNVKEDEREGFELFKKRINI